MLRRAGLVVSKLCLLEEGMWWREGGGEVGRELTSWNRTVASSVLSWFLSGCNSRARFR